MSSRAKPQETARTAIARLPPNDVLPALRPRLRWLPSLRLTSPWMLTLALPLLLTLSSCGQQPGRQDHPRSQESWSERPSPRDTREATRPDANQSYDLSADEDRGGHTLRKHVGRSDDELRARLSRERNISAASTWTDRSAAEETVAQALRAEHPKIESWEDRGDRRANLALHYNAGRVIGRTLLRDADQSVPSTHAVIVLEADGPGFYVLTAYPEDRE
jgi:hypothetical protein